jgi:hypothetical protein
VDGDELRRVQDTRLFNQAENKLAGLWGCPFIVSPLCVGLVVSDSTHQTVEFASVTSSHRFGSFTFKAHILCPYIRLAFIQVSYRHTSLAYSTQNAFRIELRSNKCDTLRSCGQNLVILSGNKYDSSCNCCVLEYGFTSTHRINTVTDDHVAVVITSLYLGGPEFNFGL